MSIFDDVGDFVGNVVKVAGAPALAVADAVSDVPVLGPVLNLATGPMHLADAIASGTRIDKALSRQLENDIKQVKEVAPYAQMVISVVPGIGPVASGAISAGLALASGKGIDEVLIEGVKGALPGGPIAAAAFEAAVGVAQGKDFGEIAGHAVSGIAESAGIKLPPAAEQLLSTGLVVAQRTASGDDIKDIAIDEVIKQLPEDLQGPANEAKAVGNGAKLSDILLEHAQGIIPDMPPEAKAALMQGLNTGIAMGSAKLFQNGGHGGSPEEVQAYIKKIDDENRRFKGLTPEQRDKELNKTGTNLIPERVYNDPNLLANWLIDVYEKSHPGIKLKRPTGILSTREEADDWVTSQFQAVKKKALANYASYAKDRDAAQAKKRKAFASYGKAATGALVAQDLMSHVINPVQFIAVRSALPQSELKSFDTMVAYNIGKVKYKAPKGLLTEEGKAGYWVTRGMMGLHPNLRAEMMQSIIADPKAKIGAKVAIQEIANERKSVWQKILDFFGLGSNTIPASSQRA